MRTRSSDCWTISARQFPDDLNPVTRHARHAWMSLLALACAPGALAATGPDDRAAIARAIVHLSPLLQARIESSEVWYQTPRTRTESFLYFSMHPDPCSKRPSTDCEVSAVAFRLRDQAPLPGTCVREFVTISLDQEHARLPPQTRGDRQVALGTDCTAIESSRFARLSGVDPAEAARLMLWLQTQQAHIRLLAEAEQPAIECTEAVPSRQQQEGCAGGANAAFARLSLSSIREIGLIDWAPRGGRWQRGQHYEVSVWGKNGGMGYHLQIHLERNTPGSISMRWEPPAPF